MSTTFTQYTVKKTLPIFGEDKPRKGDTFFWDDNTKSYRTRDGKVLPSFVNINDKTNFTETERTYPFESGSHVMFTYRGHNQTGVIQNPITPFDTYIKIDGSYDNIVHVKLEDIEKPVSDYKYWYISSTGQIRSAIIGIRESADEFRKQCGNYFDTKSEAEYYIKHLPNIKNSES